MSYPDIAEQVASQPKKYLEPKTTLSVQEDSTRRVQMALKALENEIDAVHRLLEVLEERLGPVLGFADKEAGPEDKTGDPNGSPLGNRLDFHTDSLVMANYRIRSMLDRLEV